MTETFTPPFQLIAPDGTTRGKPEHPIDPDTARTYYRSMTLARAFDDEATFLQRRGELGLWLRSLGQEAAQIGSITALQDRDYVFPSYREHAAALHRGLSPGEILAQWRGVSHSGWNPAEHGFHIYTLVLAAQLLHATGYAMGIQRDRDDGVVLAYFGDGASSEGDAGEAFNIAAVNAAPVLFLCQNNAWAISTPTHKQFASPIHVRAKAYGLWSAVVDGNDVFAVRDVTERALDHIRSGAGPALIEALTYRRAGHSTADDPTRYRSDAELADHAATDPIARVAALLAQHDWADDAFFKDVERDARALASRTRSECLALPEPRLETYFGHVLADGGAVLDNERTAALARHLVPTS
ncbi:thiamine pyrophosphate-dependent dehydrogenase E1 component subunit alpha [Rhodococcus jostii]|uniref:2-oxoisovalerate dehydrogenase subunit alpha n=1 Tax=Rhodococcus jostii TaxID=132919 RepID=A0ABU4CUL5_RHOJO|nr:thiamine pyrophosphate-dependent enzyme [Rhodococcus jostii]MDV6286792.1 thiamine pyrophosphate-dependent enzyme [Rhodococcus jostii]